MLKLIPLALCTICTLAAVAGMLGSAERHTLRASRSGRSVVLAPYGMVATSHPLAAQIGLDVLKNGGNAVDAAIAVNAALGLMEPMSCGIGGDLFALVWDAKTKTLHGLNASGRSPYQATREFFAERNLEEIPTIGPLSWSVPGCVDGWEELRKRFGSRPLTELLEPTARYADAGFPVTEVIGGYWAGAEPLLARTPEAAKTYLLDGRSPRAGERMKNPQLAATYRLLGKEGRDAFYKGEIATKIVSYSQRVGGLFTMKDFADHHCVWVEPASTDYRGYRVWQIPPPGQGISVLQMLNLMEGYDIAKMGHDSPDYWHLFVEAKKIAYADRSRHYADPTFAKVPVKELVSKPYAESRRGLIDMQRAKTDIEPGDPKLGKSDTVYLCVVDKDRNCASLIQSNYFGFGSGLAADDLGFVIQNRGNLFALDPKHPNTLEPHKLPFHTIIPALVTRDGQPWFVFGVMGGDMQPQGQVQVLNNLIDFGMDVQAAGEAPRIQHLGSATPTGKSAAPLGGLVEVEQGIPEAVTAELIRRGHQLTRVKTNGGGYQGILIDPKTNFLHGGSEARKDGCAVGY